MNPPVVNYPICNIWYSDATPKHKRLPHAEERPHECDVCGVTFTESDEVEKHHCDSPEDEMNVIFVELQLR